MGLYRDFETSIPTLGAPQLDGLAPVWLARPAGQAWLGAHGDLKDWLVDRLKQAVKARCASIAPSDALPALGSERLLARGLVEDEPTYRARIQAAWDLWQYGGTAWGLLKALVAGGFPTPVIQCQGSVKQYQLDAGGNLVTQSLTPPLHLGGTPAELWSDFAVYLPQPWPTRWLGVAPADGSNEQKTCASLIGAWKPAHARCVKLVVINGKTLGFGGLVVGGWNLGTGTNTNWTPPVG
jgi:hypothetical protein